MKSLKYLLLSLFFISYSFLPVFAQENSSYFFHTIEKGQSLYSIASMYDVTPTAIINLNPGCEDKLYAGETLKIPQSKEKKKRQIFHTIQPQETLYRLTVKYNVSAEDICDANPGLSADNFKIGKVICIPTNEEISAKTQSAGAASQSKIKEAVKPNCKDMHQVKRKETIYSISKEYGITEQELTTANPELKDGLKKGSFLCIPYPVVKKEQQIVNPPSDSELFSKNKAKKKRISTLKAAVILPFMLDGASKSESGRMIEYYEGFLMAVDSLKRMGVSLDLYVYDSGNESNPISTILAKNELKEMDVIFGPLYQQHIKPLASFAKKNGIRLVIPFTSKDNEVFNNPFVYQINTPQSYLYSEVYEHFTRKFNNPNIIILETGTVDKDKVNFITGLRKELKRKNISCKTVQADASSAILKGALDNNKENIFVPVSGSNVTLIKTLPELMLLVKNNPAYQIHLFGYPEWQTYTRDHLAEFYEMDTYFYSSFYTNNLLPESIHFTSSYRRWFSKDMANTFPKYGMLGFDTGFFFLKGLSKYGSEFENNLSNMNMTPIQTGFSFERVNNWGGFINKKVFFVHFTKDFELVKLDFE